MKKARELERKRKEVTEDQYLACARGSWCLLACSRPQPGCGPAIIINHFRCRCNILIVHRMAHFAYHATLEPEQPLDTAYFLYDKSPILAVGHHARRSSSLVFSRLPNS